MTDEKIEKTIRNLNKNNIETFYVKAKTDVAGIVSKFLEKGMIVSAGGSMSLAECMVNDFLKNGDYEFVKAQNADVYFCSANAITESGEIYNVDGRSNRISAICYGPKKIVMVVSVNKIVKNLDEAIKRVKTIAAPKNCVRLNCDTYCRNNGYCISLDMENPEMTDGCDSKDRICCNYLVSSIQREKGRINVIFVEEECGF